MTQPQYTIRLSRDQINADRKSYVVSDDGALKLFLCADDNASDPVYLNVTYYPENRGQYDNDLTRVIRRYLAHAWLELSHRDPAWTVEGYTAELEANKRLLIDMAREYIQDPTVLADVLRSAYAQGTQDAGKERPTPWLSSNELDAEYSNDSPDSVPF